MVSINKDNCCENEKLMDARRRLVGRRYGDLMIMKVIRSCRQSYELRYLLIYYRCICGFIGRRVGSFLYRKTQCDSCDEYENAQRNNDWEKSYSFAERWIGYGNRQWMSITYFDPRNWDLVREQRKKRERDARGL